MKNAILVHADGTETSVSVETDDGVGAILWCPETNDITNTMDVREAKVFVFDYQETWKRRKNQFLPVFIESQFTIIDGPLPRCK